MSIVRHHEEHHHIPKGFRVVHQEHRIVPTVGGELEGEHTIHFETPSGVRSFVTVPDRMYNAETVGHMIADKAEEIEKVHNMTERPATQGRGPQA